MSVSATLTMLVSTTSSRAPSATEKAMSHLRLARGAAWAAAGGREASRAAAAVMATPLLPGVDRELGAHAGAERDAVGDVVEVNPHRHALHDLGEVAGGVVGREQAEASA